MALPNPYQALTYAQSMIKYQRLTDSAVAMEILDEAASRLWMAAPWSWTVSTLTPITLSANTTDYSAYFPANFALVYKAVMTQGNEIVGRPLAVVPSLNASAANQGEIEYVMPIPPTISTAGAGVIRVGPRPTSALPSTAQTVYLHYKIQPPNITSANAVSADGAQVPPRWWHVYKSLVLENAYKYSDDSRGFDITIDPVSKQAKLGGQMAVTEYYLNEMRQKENLPVEWETYLEAKAERR